MMRRRSLVSAGGLAGLSFVALAFGACKKEPPAPTTWKQPAPAQPAAPGPAAAVSPHATSPHAGMPPTAPAPTPAATAPRGTVVETMDAGGYTYARLDVAGAQVWVAGPQTKLAVGATVSLGGGTPMANFRSNTLGRTFDEIYFLGTLTDSAADAPLAPVAGGGVAHGAAPAIATGAPLAPVAGGHTIERVYAATATLAGKPVAVRGRVVKYNADIMGKNWLHLQDGSGAAGTNDLTVTTSGTAKVGDVIVARGVLAVDRDFGGGYKYAVLIEDATLSEK